MATKVRQSVIENIAASVIYQMQEDTLIGLADEIKLEKKLHTLYGPSYRLLVIEIVNTDYYILS